VRDYNDFFNSVGEFQQVYNAANTPQQQVLPYNTASTPQQQVLSYNTASTPVIPKAEVSYRVKPGDTLSQIAKSNNTTVKELLKINPALTTNPKYDGGRTIFSNTKIVLEPGVKAPKVTPAPKTEPDTRGDNPAGSDGQPDQPAGGSTPPAGGSTPPAGGSTPPAGGSTPPAGGTTFVNPTVAATNSINDQLAALTAQIAAMQAAAAQPAKPTVAGQKTIRKTGGVVEVYQLMSDGTLGSKIEEYKDFGARDSVLKMFENTGLGQAYINSLMESIDKVYEENIMPTDAQVLNSIYNSQAYKTRFAANEAIKKRMADGKGRPGDRLLTPYEYIQTEKAYEEILREAGMSPGFYDQQEDFANFIALGVSTAELTDRVNIAKNALNNADQGIKTALKDFYGLTDQDLTAYLLDKDRAINVIDSRFKYTTEEAKKMYTSAEIGGAALRAGQMSDKAFAEEIYGAGKAGQAESAFQAAATQQKDYQRLMSLYGETAGTQDLAREELALAGGTDVTIRKKKLASQERAKFQQRSAIDTSSLGRRDKTADI
jgi:LysM repeat protein